MFGPRVIGEEAFKAAESVVDLGANLFGPRVVGTSPAAAEAAEVEPLEGVTVDPAEDEQYRVAQIREMLADNPAHVDLLMDLESRRPLPRVSALAALREAEAINGDRPEVLVKLDGLQALVS